MSEYLLDDEEVEAITEEQRHTQMMQAFGRLINAVESQNENESPNEELQSLLSANKGMIAEFLNKLKSLTQPQTPNVNVEVNQEMVVSSVEQSSRNIVDALNSFSKEINNYTEAINAPKSTVARVTQRNSLGFAEEIILNTKTVSKP